MNVLRIICKPVQKLVMLQLLQHWTDSTWRCSIRTLSENVRTEKTVLKTSLCEIHEKISAKRRKIKTSWMLPKPRGLCLYARKRKSDAPIAKRRANPLAMGAHRGAHQLPPVAEAAGVSSSASGGGGAAPSGPDAPAWYAFAMIGWETLSTYVFF